MLGEHGVGLEVAVAVENAFGDDTLPFAEEIGQNARERHRNILQRIGYFEGDRRPLTAHDGAFFDESTKPDAFAGLDALFQNIARDVKEDDAVLQRKQHEDQRQAERRDTAADQNSSLLLSCHCVSPPSVSASEPELPCQIFDAVRDRPCRSFRSRPRVTQGFDSHRPGGRGPDRRE